ncbi:MAG TPA: hypothetical protein VF803_01270 [Candidatus Paceibacterota bacterium]
MKKFLFPPEGAGFLTALLLAVAAFIRVLKLALIGKMTLLAAITWLGVVAVLFMIVWDATVYLVAWPQMTRDEFRRFCASRRSLLHLFSP